MTLTPGRLLLLLTLLAGLAASRSSVAAQPASASEDSVQAHYRAVTALRTFQYHRWFFVDTAVVRLACIDDCLIYAVCDISVGDFCYGTSNGKLAFGARLGTFPNQQRYAPRNLPRRFRSKSNTLINEYIARLATELETIPGDRWIWGEFVRLATERGTLDRALDETDNCRADAWWCGALRAHVVHLSGEWASADSLWTVALRAMPEVERCGWLDPTWVVPGSRFLRAYESATCADRIRLAERAWWLSDPLFMVAGNERRSEHLSRTASVVLMEGAQRRIRQTPAMTLSAPAHDRVISLAEVARSGMVLSFDGTFGYPYGPVFLMWGYPELVMRTGTPVHFGRTEYGEYVAQHPGQRHAFIPDEAILLNHLAADQTDWEPRNEIAFEFMSDWGRVMHSATHQVGYFRRGDSARMVAASELPMELRVSSRAVVTGLFVQRDFDQPQYSVRGSSARGRARFARLVPPESALISIEMRSVGGDVARTRFASGPPVTPDQRVALSDIILVENGAELPATLAEAETRMLGSTVLPRGSATTVFWEMYGLEPGETPQISLAAYRERGSLLSELGRVVTLRSGTDSVSVDWEEPPVAGSAIEPRSISLNLGTLLPGSYILAAIARVPGQSPVRVSRRLEIR